MHFASLILVSVCGHILVAVAGYLQIETVKCCQNELTKCNITVKSEPDSQCVDAEIFLPYDLNYNYLVSSQIFLEAGRKWLHLFTTKPEDGCQFSQHYMTVQTNDILSHMGFKPGVCRGQKGRYVLRDYCMKFTTMKSALLPKGRVKGFLKILLKNSNTVVICLESIFMST